MPGMICELYLEKVEERDSAIVLPSRIVQLDHANHPFVWVHQSGKAHKRMVETGPFVQEGVTVLSGISVGDEVLVEGQQKVSEQMECGGFVINGASFFRSFEQPFGGWKYSGIGNEGIMTTLNEMSRMKTVILKNVTK